MNCDRSIDFFFSYQRSEFVMFTVQCNLHLIDICINVNSAIKYLSDKIVLLENNYMYLADLDNHDCEKNI